MAITLEDSNTAGYNADPSPSISLAGSPTDDNLLILGLQGHAAETPTAPTGGNNSWTLAIAESYDSNSTRCKVWLWYKFADSDSAAHEITGMSSDCVVFIAEYSSTSGWESSVLDKTSGGNSTTGTNTSQSSGSTATTSQNDELLVGWGGWIYYDATVVDCDTDSFTTRGSYGDGDSAVFREAAWGDRIVTSTGTYAATVDQNGTASNAACVIATFMASVVSTIELAGTIAGTSTTSTGLPAEPDTETNGTSTVFGDADTIVYIDAHTVPAPD